MGNYIEQEELVERIGSTRFNSLCGVNEDEIDSLATGIIARAEAMIDSHACILYAVPLPASELVEEWAFTIAEYELYKRSSSSDVPQKIKNSYDETLRLLAKLAEGEIKIPGAVSVSSDGTPLTTRSFAVSSSDSLMDSDSLKGF
ncbi:MAG: hypothetical protein A2020_05680 [Lentisphaerae bacterium GWF2_45_14]|nr:MAG: hypothetical protein A2020_05680 [Lentisphaerae bacterium GWF2_45_14]